MAVCSFAVRMPCAQQTAAVVTLQPGWCCTAHRQAMANTGSTRRQGPSCAPRTFIDLPTRQPLASRRPDCALNPPGLACFGLLRGRLGPFFTMIRHGEVLKRACWLLFHPLVRATEQAGRYVQRAMRLARGGVGHELHAEPNHRTCGFHPCCSHGARRSVRAARHGLRGDGLPRTSDQGRCAG